MFHFLSKKESLAVLLFSTALICVLNASVFGNTMPTTSCYVQLTQQSVSIGTAYICILYAASTWVYHSNYSEPRQHMRYVLLAMLMIMILANLVSFILLIRRQFFCPLNEAIKMADLFSPFGWICNFVAIGAVLLTILLLTVAFIVVAMTAITKRKLSARADGGASASGIAD
ncbi:uncharacterized protein LOC6563723 [Drosophila grimshawi]|uniref:uncharacterized protein LOC6563723 n=1 Tax=Drosophila grimshawi TaxID=7222 RepID=UPI001C93472C|nr:uncharacterized protein LOC6563723 [Drosophila grimshawi]